MPVYPNELSRYSEEYWFDQPKRVHDYVAELLREHPDRNLYYLLAYAWGHADAAREREADAAPVEDLPPPARHILADRVLRVVKQGLDRSYVEERVVFAGVRGKLELGETLKRNLLAQARTACTVEEFTHNIPQNQILRSTLRRVLSLPDLSSAVRSEVGLGYPKAGGDFRKSKCGPPPSGKSGCTATTAPTTSSCNSAASSMNRCLWLRTDGQIVDVRRQKGVMARLFEDFVANFYKAEQNDYRVSSQSPLPWHEAASAVEENMSRLPRMVPDVVLESESRRIVLDTSFHRKPLAEGRFGGRRVRSGHLYQVFAYIENRNAGEPEGAGHEGLLLYPVVEDAFAYDFRLKGHRIQVRSIDLDQDWQGVHQGSPYRRGTRRPRRRLAFERRENGREHHRIVRGA